MDLSGARQVVWEPVDQTADFEGMPATMRIKAAVLRGMGLEAPYARSKPLTIEDVELDAPGTGEVLVRIVAAGLCHSDLSVINGSRPRPMPMAIGHEAAGVVIMS